MAKNETKRLSPKDLQVDRDALHALQSIATYSPANPAYTVKQLQQLTAALEAAQKAEVQASEAARVARDAAAAAEWNFHNAILGVKDQVIAQFGKNSDQIQMLGLKKKSEYKSPGVRRVKVS